MHATDFEYLADAIITCHFDRSGEIGVNSLIYEKICLYLGVQINYIAMRTFMCGYAQNDD